MKYTKNTFDLEIKIYYFFLFWSKRSSSRVGSRKKNTIYIHQQFLSYKQARQPLTRPG